jgi:hypothetical protein
LATSLIIGNLVRIRSTNVDVDVVASFIMKLNDVALYLSLLSSFLQENSLYFDVNEIINYQKLVGNLGKMRIANLGRQH